MVGYTDSASVHGATPSGAECNVLLGACLFSFSSDSRAGSRARAELEIIVFELAFLLQRVAMWAQCVGVSPYVPFPNFSLALNS